MSRHASGRLEDTNRILTSLEKTMADTLCTGHFPASSCADGAARVTPIQPVCVPPRFGIALLVFAVSFAVWRSVIDSIRVAVTAHARIANIPVHTRITDHAFLWARLLAILRTTGALITHCAAAFTGAFCGDLLNVRSE